MLRRRKNLIVVSCIFILALILQGCISTSITINIPKSESTAVPEETEIPKVTEKPEVAKQEEPSNTAVPIENTEEPQQEEKKIIDTQNYEFNGEYHSFYYDQLTDAQKVVFDYIVQNRDIRNEYIGFTNIEAEDVDKVMDVINNETLIHVNTIKCEQYESNENVLFLNIVIDETSMTDEQIDAATKAADKIAKKIKGKTEEEIIINIYNWITKNIKYDETQQRENCANIYGALVEKCCVCEGFARAFSWLCSKKGIVHVNLTNIQETHMWNAVCLDHKWYHVDTTNGEFGTCKHLLEGNEIMENDIYIPDESNFNCPEFSDENYYPDQEKAKQYIKNEKENIKAFEILMATTEDEDFRVLCADGKFLAEQIIKKTKKSNFYRYLLTDEYNTKGKKLEEIVEEVNEINQEQEEES